MIYIVNAAGTDMYKVGYTKDRPEQRLKELQTGNHANLKVLHIFEGSLEEEAALHRVFHDYNTHGEWFKLDMSKMFAIVVNYNLGHRVNIKKETYDFKEYLRNFHISAKKPEDLHVSLPFDIAYELYGRHCILNDWTQKPEKYFRSEMNRYNPAGKIKASGETFYNMVLRDDSPLGG